ncbi:hypothetical protein PT2222_290032 [Paraburkholderia tropica]
MALRVPSRSRAAGIQGLRQRHRAEGPRWLRRGDHDGIPDARLSAGGRRFLRRSSAHGLHGSRLRILAQHVRHALFGTAGHDADLGPDVRGGNPLLIGPRFNAAIVDPGDWEAMAGNAIGPAPTKIDNKERNGNDEEATHRHRAAEGHGPRFNAPVTLLRSMTCPLSTRTCRPT